MILATNSTLVNLQKGQTEQITRVITRQEVEAFLFLTGDSNPLHSDEDFAKAVGLDGCIVPGGFIGCLVAGLIGSKLPGHGTVAASMNMKFEAPVYIGEEVTVQVIIGSIDLDRGFVILHLFCCTNKTVLTGKALVSFLSSEGG